MTGGAADTPTVRDATFDVLRRHGLTTVFANPGSTEVPFLADLPDDMQFVLALHEGSVVGMATGWALGAGRPGFVLLHTVAGLGNAVGALATARQNRAPLVVLVGAQDRRHLAAGPFLSGPLDGLAGEYPVWVGRPVRAGDVPAAVARAAHEAVTGRGPALVVVPMDDWDAPADDDLPPGPPEVVRAGGVDATVVTAVADRLSTSSTPVMVVGAGADDPASWDALVSLAERRGMPVWQEAFGARAGFPQHHPLFAGHLPAARSGVREALGGHDLVLVVGAPVFRQYPYEPGPFVAEGTRLVLVTDDPAEAHRAPADLVVLAPLPAFLVALAEVVSPGESRPARERDDPTPPAPVEGEGLRAEHVLAALAARLPDDTVLVEETPSSRPALHALVPARAPLGFVSAAGGGLGFALPAAVGLRMALPGRPVVAVVGDGSALYQVQALWSAARYGAGVLTVVLVNGRYAILDRLVALRDPDAKAPWPGFEDVDVAALARGLACPAIEVDTYGALTRVFDEVLPSLAARHEPLVLAVRVVADTRSPH